jgi:hypothetical protein
MDPKPRIKGGHGLLLQENAALLGWGSAVSGYTQPVNKPGSPKHDPSPVEAHTSTRCMYSTLQEMKVMPPLFENCLAVRPQVPVHAAQQQQSFDVGYDWQQATLCSVLHA